MFHPDQIENAVDSWLARVRITRDRIAGNKQRHFRQFGTTCSFLDRLLFRHRGAASAANIVKEAGADFIKTGTGWAPWGPSIRQIKLIRETVGPDFGVKASGMEVEGSIYNFMAYVEAGATRFGLISAVRIIENFKILKNDVAK